MDILFEENDHLQQQSTGYQPSPPLNFLRPKPNYSTPYSTSTTTATIPTTTKTAATNGSPNIPLPTMRRPRAGTMPSFLHPEMNSNTNRPNPNAAFLLSTIEAGRHRSGSLNLPPVDFWPLRHDSPLSPSSEQLLQNDSDFSIARTMRSLGLEEEEVTVEKKEPLVTSLFHQQTPPEFLLPSRSLLSGNNRNRSYSVNATAKYETPSPSPPLIEQQVNKLNFASPLEGFTRQQLRPRASSMGRADAVRLGATAMLWSNPANNARSSPLVSMSEEESFEQTISLGDSELLANMLRTEEKVANAPIEVIEIIH